MHQTALLLVAQNNNLAQLQVPSYTRLNIWLARVCIDPLCP
jgi:hypothetical protein